MSTAQRSVRSRFIWSPARKTGDALGAALAHALMERERGRLNLAGVGGRAMAAAGIASPFAIEDLSIVGLAAIPRRLPLILRRIRETADAIVAAQPDVLVIIDSPDFTHRVARRVRRLAPSIPILDYVSPSVWAWRPWRARTMRAYIDCVLAVLPFEPAAYLRLGGPPCVYVGHPMIERIAELRPNADELRRRRSDPLVLVLPGSRSSELRQLLATSNRDRACRRAGRPGGPGAADRAASSHADTRERCRLAVAAAHRQRPGGEVGGIPRGASGSRGVRHRHARTGASAVPPGAALGCRCSRNSSSARRGRPNFDVILANLVIGENVVRSFSSAIVRRMISPRRLFRCSAIRHSGSVRWPLSKDSIRSWVSAPCRPAGRPQPSCLIPPGAAAAISVPSAQRRSHVNRRAFRTALPMRRPAC